MQPTRLSLPLVSIRDADPAVRPILDDTVATIGAVPNMYAAMANLPALLDTYVHGYHQFRTGSDFTAAEQEVVFLVVSRMNGCAYCVTAHSVIADRMSGLDIDVTDAIRDGEPIADQRLAALAEFTGAMFDTRGVPDPGAARAFLDAGFTERHILSIVLAIAVKTISNYTNHLFDTPVDPMFAARTWHRPTTAALESDPTTSQGH